MVDSRTLLRIISNICDEFYEGYVDVEKGEDVIYQLARAKSTIDAINSVSVIYPSGDHEVCE